MKTERLLYIDRLKGFTIFLVVLGHVLQYNTQNPFDNIIFNIIYSFHMPFFFFLSGYVANITTKITSITSAILFIKNKSIALLIPMIAWPIIRHYFFTENVDLTSIFTIIYNQILDPSLWFLKTLYEILLVYLVFWIVSNYFNSKQHIFKDILVLIFIASFLLAISYAIHSKEILTFLLNFVFFMIGVFLSKYESLKLLIQNKIVLLSASLLFMALIGHFKFNELNFIYMKFLKVCITITVITIFYNYSKTLKISKNIDDYLCLMGRNSLIIYVTHFSFFYVLNDKLLLSSDISFILLLILTIPISLILISLSMFIGRLIALQPILNFLFYGVRIKNKNIN
ncbi:acyltransferase family protein [Algibacter sp. L1A34]|uniref:acyltransferase family protein n=1 Tax=Algibacter sp. L1A34 TaxID=2686365 RepID=UPI00131CC645|nr:acyltransferase family protein [Algibacter sp. L1A34]